MSDTTELKLWELDNPSDKYTFYAESVEVAGVAVAMISTHFGAHQPRDREAEKTPIIFGWEAWLEQKGIDNVGDYLTANAPAIIAAYKSMLICDESKRDELDATIAALPESEREQWINDYHETKRTSTRDIRDAALSLARQLEAACKE